MKTTLFFIDQVNEFRAIILLCEIMKLPLQIIKIFPDKKM